ncbi:MAG: hypothetical protein WA724_09100 [Candidatus Dormiibacterota bacterium]
MSAPRSRSAGLRALAVTAGVLAVLTAVATIVLAIANAPTFHGLLNAELPAFDVPITFGILGVLVATRQRQNPIGWLFLFIAVVGGIQGVADGYAHFAFVTDVGAPAGIWALWVDSWVTSTIFPAGAVALMLLLFPDGHLPSRKWNPLAITCVVVTAVLVPASIFYPGPLSTSTNFATPNNPIGLPVTGGLEVAVQSLGLLWLPGLALFLAAASAPLVRMRRAAGDERPQLKWIAYAVTVTAVAYIPLTLLPASNVSGSNADLAIGFGILVPIAAGVAIFKHRLYDIDRLISRSLSYAIVTGLLIGVYVGLVTLATRVLPFSSPLGVAASTLVAVALFNPVRKRVQRLVDRRFNRARYDAEATVSAFAQRVRDDVDLAAVSSEFVRAVQISVEPAHVSLWLRPTESGT